MAKLTCPYCKEIGISPLKKIFVGGNFTQKCRNCGNELHPHIGKSFILIIPSIILSILLGLFGLNIYLVVIISVILFFILFIEWVPLVAIEEDKGQPQSIYSGYSKAIIFCTKNFDIHTLRLPGFGGNAEVIRVVGSSVDETEIVSVMLMKGCDKNRILLSPPDYGVGFIK